MPQYTVKQGDCMLSIAADQGYLWETLWNHGDNAGLKALRKDPHVLLPGDVVVLPDKVERAETGSTDQCHKFVLRTVKAQVRLRLLDLKRQPRPQRNYVAIVDGAVSSGESDADGYITLKVKPNAKELKLTVNEGTRTEHYSLSLGAIDPIEELSGVRQRLANLGYPCGTDESEVETVALTKAALRAFQQDMGLEATAEPDDATRQKLLQIHGS